MKHLLSLIKSIGAEKATLVKPCKRFLSLIGKIIAFQAIVVSSNLTGNSNKYIITQVLNCNIIQLGIIR